jgi:hypothetical protein
LHDARKKSNTVRKGRGGDRHKPFLLFAIKKQPAEEDAVRSAFDQSE